VTFLEPPRSAAWQHRGARNGFEVVFLERSDDQYRIEGSTAAVEGDEQWAVHYRIVLDRDWRTRTVYVRSRSAAGRHELTLQCDEAGRWECEGERAAHLDGCVDVDLESSALTNAFPARRLALQVGEEAEAPAAYVRALDLAVERLEQRYVRLGDDGGLQRYRYSAPRFGFECDLVYDKAGLLLDYPGIARRAA
jgi:hypothetical protein